MPGWDLSAFSAARTGPQPALSAGAVRLPRLLNRAHDRPRPRSTGWRRDRVAKARRTRPGGDAMPGILPPPTPTITARSAAAAAPAAFSRRRGLAAVAIHAAIWSAAAGSF